MKKLLVYITVLALVCQIGFMDPYNIPYDQIQTVQTYKALDLIDDASTLYRGDYDYLTRVNNYNFTDVYGSDKLDAIRLATHDITQGVAPRTFGPNRQIKNIEIITMLVRMYGNDETILASLNTRFGEAPRDAYITALYDMYYNEAKRIGILDTGEEVPHAEYASRENIARWVINASNMPDPFPTDKLETANDWTRIEPRNVKPVEKLLDYSIIDFSSPNQFNPKGSMTRIEFARLLGNIYDIFAGNFGLTEDFGIVVGIHSKLGTNGGAAINYTIRKPDNTLANINVVESNTNDAYGIVVYKNGDLATHRALSLGDEVKFTLSGDQIKYAEVMSEDVVTRRLIETFDGFENVEVLQGLVLSNLEETDKTDGKDLMHQRIRIELDDDAMIDLVSTYDKIANTHNVFPIMNGLKFASPASIKAGDKVTVYVQGDNVLYVSMGTVPVKAIKGSLRDVDYISQPAQVSVLGYDNHIYTYPVDNHATIMVNDYVASIQDLKVGANVTIRVLNGKAVTVSASSYQPSTGYIPQNGEIEFGTISTISGNTFTMQSYSAPFYIAPDTPIYRGETPITADKLVPGDRLKLYFDEINSSTPSKIEAEGKEQLVQSLLKGKLFNYNQYTDEVEVVDRYKLNNLQWQSQNAPYTATYKLAKDAAIYDGNTPINLTQLNKDYFKRDAYMVLRDNYGRDEIGKIVFKDGTERHYNDVIDDYNTVLNAFELGNNVNIGYDDATIFVQDDRVVDASVLRDNASVYVLSNQNNGVDSAQVVSVLPHIDPIFSTLYVGAVDTVNPYDLTIDNYSSVQNYAFTPVANQSKTLYFNDETSIYDFEKDAYITRETLFNDGYSSLENKEKSKGKKGLPYKHYYGVFITDGNDNIIATTLRFKGLVQSQNIDDKIFSEKGIKERMERVLNDVRFTRGTIAGFNDAWERIEINNAQNYVPYSGTWQASTTNFYIELGDAIIIKNEQKINYRDLNTGDKITTIRYDEDAFVIYVD